MADNTRPVLLTGSSGKVARGIIPLLTEHGWSLRLTDIAPLDDPLPANAEFVAANLRETDAIREAAAGTRAIVHLGAL